MGVILSYNKFLKTYKTRGYRIKHLENYKPLFPIKTNPKLSGIIADLIGDGILQGDPKWRLDFTSNEVDELKRFEKEIFSLFSVRGKIRKCSSNKYSTYNIAINSSPIARILYLCGVPSGQKVLKSFKIPSWILEDKECFRRFCRRLFTCEGNIAYEKNRKLPQIRMELWKKENLIKDAETFMSQIQKSLKKYYFIDVTVKIQNRINIRKDKIKTKPVRLYIHGESVFRFFREIGFEGKKQKHLKALLNN